MPNAYLRRLFRYPKQAAACLPPILPPVARSRPSRHLQWTATRFAAKTLTRSRSGCGLWGWLQPVMDFLEPSAPAKQSAYSPALRSRKVPIRSSSRKTPTLLKDGWVEALERPAQGAYVRPAGLDFRQGEILLEEGRVLDPAALSLVAAANHPDLPVVRKPVITILATGDELLAPGSAPGPGQIIASNSFGVAAIVEECGATAIDLGIAPDDRQAISGSVKQAAGLNADILVTLGGASVGEHDLVQEVLTGEGMALDFWRIAMRPGKPLMYGVLGPMRFLGLPGNPVSSLVCSHLFLKPLIAKLAGRRHDGHYVEAVLETDLAANDRREDYIRSGVYTGDDGVLHARPFPVQDSSMLKTLADANGLIVRPPHAPAASKGTPCRVLMLR